MKKIAALNIENKLESSKTPAKNHQQLASTQSVTNYKNPEYQQLNTNNLMVHKTHSIFLKSRQDFSQQLSEIIQLQIACAEKLFEN